MSAARPLPILTTREKWELYEQEKARLQALGLSPVAYEKAIRALTTRLGL